MAEVGVEPTRGCPHTILSRARPAQVMAGERVELSRGCPHTILSRARLPVPPPGQMFLQKLDK